MAEPTDDDTLPADLRRWLLAMPMQDVTRLVRFHLVVATTSTAIGLLLLSGDPAQFRISWLCSVALAWMATAIYSRRLTLMRRGAERRQAIPVVGPTSPPSPLQPERRDWWRDRNNVGD